MSRCSAILRFGCAYLLVILCLAPVDFAPAAAQAPTSFAVISVKEFKRTVPMVLPRVLMKTGPGGVRATARNLRSLIEYAYGIQDYQLADGDTWTIRELFTLDATTSAPATGAQLRLMMQAALKTRFGLQLVKTSAPTPVFALVVGPGGVKFRSLAPGEQLRPAISTGDTRMFRFATPNDLVGMLDAVGAGRLLGRTLVDETGLTGRYDIAFTMPRKPVFMYGHQGFWVDYRTELRPALQAIGLDLKPEVIVLDTYRIQSAHPPTPN